MFGSKVFGHGEVFSEILHPVFEGRERGLTKELVKPFGLLYTRLLGWPVAEPRIVHSRLVKLAGIKNS